MEHFKKNILNFTLCVCLFMMPLILLAQNITEKDTSFIKNSLVWNVQVKKGLFTVSGISIGPFQSLKIDRGKSKKINTEKEMIYFNHNLKTVNKTRTVTITGLYNGKDTVYIDILEAIREISEKRSALGVILNSKTDEKQENAEVEAWCKKIIIHTSLNSTNWYFEKYMTDSSTGPVHEYGMLRCSIDSLSVIEDNAGTKINTIAGWQHLNKTYSFFKAVKINAALQLFPQKIIRIAEGLDDSHKMIISALMTALMITETDSE